VFYKNSAVTYGTTWKRAAGVVAAALQCTAADSGAERQRWKWNDVLSVLGKAVPRGGSRAGAHVLLDATQRLVYTRTLASHEAPARGPEVPLRGVVLPKAEFEVSVGDNVAAGRGVVLPLHVQRGRISVPVVIFTNGIGELYPLSIHFLENCRSCLRCGTHCALWWRIAVAFSTLLRRRSAPGLLSYLKKIC